MQETAEVLFILAIRNILCKSFRVLYSNYGLTCVNGDSHGLPSDQHERSQ